jgi:hypothetical protein
MIARHARAMLELRALPVLRASGIAVSQYMTMLSTAHDNRSGLSRTTVALQCALRAAAGGRNEASNTSAGFGLPLLYS